MSFRGIEAGRNYKWGYVCEYCEKSVEKADSISTRIGQEAKGTTWTYVTFENEQAMIEQAKAQLPGLCDAVTKEWEKGNYSRIQNYGECPFCKKHQHWDFAIQKYEKHSLGVNIFAAIFIAFIVAGVIWLIGRFIGNAFDLLTTGYKIVLNCIFFLVLIVVFIYTFIYVKKSNTTLGEEVNLLKSLEKKEPYFISWEGIWHKSIGLSRM